MTKIRGFTNIKCVDFLGIKGSGNVIDAAVILVLCRIAWIDQKTMEIPDKLNGVIAAFAVLSSFLGSDLNWSVRIIGACCVSIPMYLLNWLIEDAFGGGDIKLCIGMGWYLGWKNMLVGAFLGCMIGGLQASYLLITGKARVGEGTHMAFGPALCTGLSLALLFGDALLIWYMGLIFGV